MDFIYKIIGYFIVNAPIILFYWIVAKILCSNKISNKLFLIIAIPLFIISILLLFSLSLAMPTLITIPLTQTQTINAYLSTTYVFYIPFLLFTVILLPIIIILGLIFSWRNNNKTLLFKTLICSFVIAIMFYFASPAFYDFYEFLNSKKLSNEQKIELYSKAFNKAKLLPLKIYYSRMEVLYIDNYWVQNGDKQKYLNEYYDRVDYIAENHTYDTYIKALFKAILLKDYENVKKYIEKYESVDKKVNALVIRGYILLKDYDKAFELIDKVDSISVRYELKTILYLSMGDREQAEENFREIKKTKRYYRDKTLEDFEKRWCK